tara:strand:+ start:565 stop:816 length:252 start_codon:yes stop_codon:yes gene_type:complete
MTATASNRRTLSVSDRLAIAALIVSLLGCGTAWLVRIESMQAVQSSAIATLVKDITEIKADLKDMRADVRAIGRTNVAAQGAP